MALSNKMKALILLGIDSTVKYLEKVTVNWLYSFSPIP